MRQQIAILPDRRRLHLQDGPIDLIVEAFGAPADVRAAYAAAVARFATILDELCAELPVLRAPVNAARPCPPDGTVAQRMWNAVAPFAADSFITPMASVAGAVAVEILAAMTNAAPSLRRAYVNNGGDIALHLDAGENFNVAMIDRPDRPSRIGTATIQAGDGIAGIATSGWHGRSFSLGIADAVTVLAASAPAADAAATVIANAIDLPDHSGIVRVAANELQPDSDLAARRVTREVPPLTASEIDRALARGIEVAKDCLGRGLIVAASLHLQGTTRRIGLPADRATLHRIPDTNAPGRKLAHG
jgi:ApbE superfamily uncharacterized protein (UPF0280 family)